MRPTPPRTQPELRSVSIRDVRLGFKRCRAGFLLEFLRPVQRKRLHLVGDIIGLWGLQRTFYWPRQRIDVIRTIPTVAPSRAG